MLENRAPYSFLLTLILYPDFLMFLVSFSIYYMKTTSTKDGEMFPTFSSLSHGINVVDLNMHPHMWMRLTLHQQPGRHLFLAIV